jgi:hypothetical protein
MYDLEKEIDVPCFEAVVDRLADIDDKIRGIFGVERVKE